MTDRKVVTQLMWRRVRISSCSNNPYVPLTTYETVANLFQLEFGANDLFTLKIMGWGKKFTSIRSTMGISRVPTRYIATDLALVVSSFYLALYLRLGGEGFPPATPAFFVLASTIAAITMAVFVASGIYQIIWRYFSVRDLTQLGRAQAVATFFSIGVTYFMNTLHIPRGAFVINAIILFLSMSSVRLIRRMIHEYPSSREVRQKGRRTLIYGAGSNGRMLLNRFSTDRDVNRHVVGFLDDDYHKLEGIVGGVKVLGTGRELARILKETQAQSLFVAIAQPPGALLRQIMQTCHAAKVRVRLLEPITSTSRTSTELLRDIELADLLRRERRNLDLAPLRRLIQGRRVLVTGAGGSIGSELAKQIHRFAPEKIILVDHSEFNLFEIDRALRLYPEHSSPTIPCLVDIKDRKALQHLFRTHEPELVFHAAAYKHVHLAESSPYSTLLNNVLGTRNLLQLSEHSPSVESFVLISTDKAVSPAGVMGASKRVCELLTTHAGFRSQKRFVSVRFGNVLGSSGSLVPLLQKQIQNGEPVTITDPGAKRYFMLIPEAVSLVLRASSIAANGDIMVLKMGEPVRIVDLARSLIALMGKSEEQISILFTGLRPGEKLCEELYLSGDELSTEDPDIMVLPRGDAAFVGAFTSADRLEEKVEKLISAAIDNTPDTFTHLESLIGNQLNNRPENFPPPWAISRPTEKSAERLTH